MAMRQGSYGENTPAIGNDAYVTVHVSVKSRSADGTAVVNKECCLLPRGVSEARAEHRTAAQQGDANSPVSSTAREVVLDNMELLTQILLQLQPSIVELCNLCMVSKTWQRVIEDCAVLWNTLDMHSIASAQQVAKHELDVAAILASFNASRRRHIRAVRFGKQPQQHTPMLINFIRSCPELRAIEGLMRHDVDLPPRCVWAEQTYSLGVGFRAHDTWITQDVLPHVLQSCPKLEDLGLQGFLCEQTMCFVYKSLPPRDTLPRITRLDLSRSSGMAAVALSILIDEIGGHLQYLDLTMPEKTPYSRSLIDACVIHSIATACPKLQVLKMACQWNEHASVPQPMLHKMARSLPQLRMLDMSGWGHISDDFIITLSQHSTQLQSLAINGACRVRAAAVHELVQRCRDLRQLGLQAIDMTPTQAATVLRTVGARLHSLAIGDLHCHGVLCSDVSPALRAIAQHCGGLQHLKIVRPLFSDCSSATGAMEQLANRLTNLQSLELMGFAVPPQRAAEPSQHHDAAQHAVCALVQRNASLRCLMLICNKWLTSSSLAHIISHHPSLQVLDLTGNVVDFPGRYNLPRTEVAPINFGDADLHAALDSCCALHTVRHHEDSVDRLLHLKNYMCHHLQTEYPSLIFDFGIRAMCYPHALDHDW